MNIGASNVKGGLVLLPLGLVAGLLMSLYAFVPMVPVPGALAVYDELPRRLIRLAHIAAIMLPVLNIVMGCWIDRLSLSTGWKRAASRLLLAGAILLPAALFVEGLSPMARLVHAAALPAMIFTLGTVIVSLGALRTPLAGFGPMAARERQTPRSSRRATALRS